MTEFGGGSAETDPFRETYLKLIELSQWATNNQPKVEIGRRSTEQRRIWKSRDGNTRYILRQILKRPFKHIFRPIAEFVLEEESFHPSESGLSDGERMHTQLTVWYLNTRDEIFRHGRVLLNKENDKKIMEREIAPWEYALELGEQAILSGEDEKQSQFILQSAMYDIINASLDLPEDSNDRIVIAPEDFN